MSTGTDIHRPSAGTTAAPEGVRLHMFECGTLKCHVENIKMNQGLGEEYEIPVPWFLIEHPRGLVVIDGGNAAECASDPLFGPTRSHRAHPARSRRCTR